MTAFRLSDQTPTEPELVLQRYRKLGYDIEVHDNYSPLGDVTVIFELKNEGYQRAITFATRRDAERWNNNDTTIKPVDVQDKRTSLAFVVVPVVPFEKAQPVEHMEEMVSEPKRLIEV